MIFIARVWASFWNGMCVMCVALEVGEWEREGGKVEGGRGGGGGGIYIGCLPWVRASARQEYTWDKAMYTSVIKLNVMGSYNKIKL